MDLHQLKTFVAVAREGSITRAAEAVHLSQPAVSAHVKEIEDTLGLTLFERTSRGMSLTADGRRLLTRAEQTLAAHQALMDEAARSRETLTGRLRLGIASSSNHEAVGRLHADTAEEARRAGEVELLCEAAAPVRVIFARLASREHDPVLLAAASIIRAGTRPDPETPPGAPGSHGAIARAAR